MRVRSGQRHDASDVYHQGCYVVIDHWSEIADLNYLSEFTRGCKS